MKQEKLNNIQRWGLLSIGAILGLASLMPATVRAEQQSQPKIETASVSGRGFRKLGKLIVSPVGLGCQSYPAGSADNIADARSSQEDAYSAPVEYAPKTK